MTDRQTSGALPVGRRSPIAAMGAVRDARSAGGSAAATVTPIPTDRARDQRAGDDHQLGVGHREPESREEPEQELRERDAGPEPHRGRDEADNRSLDDHRADDLAPRRAEGAEQAELARALRHEDRERVEDDERTDEQADPCEAEQRVVQGVQELVDRLLDLCGDLDRPT